MSQRTSEPVPKIGSSALPMSSGRKMKYGRLCFLKISILIIGGYAPIIESFVPKPRNDRMQTFSTRSRLKLYFSRETNNNNYKKDNDEYYYSGIGNGNYLDEISRDRSGRQDMWQQSESVNGPLEPSTPIPIQNPDHTILDEISNDRSGGADMWEQSESVNGRSGTTDMWEQNESVNVPSEPSTPRAIPSPDRAMSIVSELKANAALFAAFAYGSLNLPGTLTVSESKVTSVTTSLSISRPLPGSDLIRTFVVLDVCTLCLMISCVAASQLLIYRLTDGSYEDIDEYYDDDFVNNNDDSRSTNSRESALGRLSTTYRNEFTVARFTFDLGLVTLLMAVGIRSLAIFDEDIVVPIAIVLGITAVFLAVAYFTTYIEVFRTAENLKGPLYSIPFLSQENENEDDKAATDRQNSIVSQIFLPFSLISVGLALYFALSHGADGTESNLSRLGPYDVTSGSTKLRVVTEKIDAEKSEARGKRRQQNTSKKAQQKAAVEKAEAEAAKKKAAEAEAKKKAEEEEKKKAEEEAKRKVEEDIKKKAEEEAYKRLEKEARRRAEEEAAAASAAAQAKVEAAMEAAMKKAQEEAAKQASSGTTTP